MTRAFEVAVAVAALVAASGCTNTPSDTYSACKTDCINIEDACFDVTLASAGTSGGLCSRNCDVDADCESNFGFSGACYQIESVKRICYQRCTTDTDCYTTSVCAQLTLSSGATDYVCVPIF